MALGVFCYAGPDGSFLYNESHFGNPVWVSSPELTDMKCFGACGLLLTILTTALIWEVFYKV